MTDQSSNQMWGGRFAAGPDAIMEAINASIGFDQRMAAQDIAGSRAHAAMLAATGVITDSDARGHSGRAAHRFVRNPERRISVLDRAGRHPHECRGTPERDYRRARGPFAHGPQSRNDQVATDFKLWVRDQLDAAETGLLALIRALLAQAEAGADWVMPGLYPSANRAAGDMGPPHDGLCRDVWP